MKVKIVFLLICLWPLGTEARMVKVAKRNKDVCKAWELKRKDCELYSKPLKIGFFKDKWRYDDGRWLSNQHLPLAGDKVEWQKVTLRKLGQRHVVEMWVWGEPQGEAQVQELHWWAFEAGGLAKKPLLDRIVQRRRLLPARELASGKTRAARFQYDPLEKHGLVLNRGSLHWKSGRDQGDIK